IWFTYHLGRLLKERYRTSREARDKPIQDLVWDYLHPEDNRGWRIQDEPSAERILREINGYETATGRGGNSVADLRADGRTAAGAGISPGIYANGRNLADGGQRDNWVSLGWGFSWPANRRILYNRASADPDGNPWPKEARLARHYNPEM